MLALEVLGMNNNTTGGVIRRLRKERGLTQAQLAALLHVSDKAVSKWERNIGLPDVALMEALAACLGTTADTLLAGRLAENPHRGGSMKKFDVFVCPVCGNIIVSLGRAEISCCGRSLQAMTLQSADDEHRITLAPVEDEWLVTFDHPMSKDHHLLFLLEMGYDRYVLTRLYAEGTQEIRMPRLPWGKFYLGCKKDGLFAGD